ncbi:MAG: Cysteine desulfurase [Candidatus Collierbacteria bacterium GW2011_GWB2_45_17]|uniref:Cysteine desulfurase n=1 Tax=Candidatus Collierbacteria bacterium GW2011_GWB2_45_17 TaxID=1618388 RepID=A0A837IF10_9BACT|nr:MAG: Cysteine desulfurase [Microgenomates group bacterium GW2011_GWC1_44_23]KKT95623.1 MAG: Cysteine desulfurase [Candidatus Collierbacteria bacterium GW2011_GWA1_45_15]KKU00477.1 MAG: Cysteine desulfurase [Candidatus Collierbacteria bacterium GW2011_GWB2_45_17]KKU08189.1 MAG: Cysteine desulfurase [Candidatus Collierbacteria bacterium GW2011_GWC2_45_40]HCX25979.1 cysteine desulfurase [Candidatus Collierbacteria bacterium]
MLDVQKIREEFPILKRKINGHDLVYLDSGATSQKPESVLRAMDDYYRNNNANIHRGVYDMSVESTRMVDEAREKVAKFIGARTEEIIFTRNASESLNLVMYSWGKKNIKEGDAVLVTRLEHHSNFVPWQVLCKENKAEFRVWNVDREGRLVDEIASVRSTETRNDGKVKLIAMTGASNAIGTLVDIKKMVEMVRSKNPDVVVVLDASQMVPHMKVDVSKLPVDFVAFSGHKMLGPTGVGVLWGKKEVLNKMEPFLYGGDMIGEVGLESTTWGELPNKFEAGTPDIAGIIGLGAAVDYLESLGMDNVREHEKELIGYALEKFKELGDLVTVYGVDNVEEKGGALAFNVKGVHAHDVAQVLNNYGIAVRSGQHCAAPLVTSFGVSAMVRATFYIYNTKEEIDYLVEKLKEVPKVFA